MKGVSTATSIYAEKRKKKRLSQAYVADTIGITVRSLSDYENGIRIPPIYVVILLDELLCCDGELIDDWLNNYRDIYAVRITDIKELR